MKIPTPDELDMAPELAVLTSLAVTLKASQFAMISVCSEVRDPEVDWRSLASEDPTGVVRTMLVLMDALSEQIGIYEEEILRRNRLRTLRSNEDF